MDANGLQGTITRDNVRATDESPSISLSLHKAKDAVLIRLVPILQGSCLAGARSHQYPEEELLLEALMTLQQAVEVYLCSGICRRYPLEEAP